jgi:type IV pilus assembly protein PilM
MAGGNGCWGIEIGAFAIKAVKVEGEAGNTRVTDFAVIPHAKVLSTPDIEANDVVRVSLGTLVSQYDLSNAAIAVSVPGSQAFARFAKLPPVSPKDVPNLVNFEAQQQIPFPLNEVEWDYQTFVTKDSPEVEVGIFAMTRDKIAERLAILQDANIHANYLTVSPIAVYNALAYDLTFDESMPGTIIVDVGTTSTDLIVCEPGRIWIRTFPLGGHHFTQALVDAFKLSYAKAEMLKLEAPESKHARHAAQAMRPVFTDLAQDIQRSIGYYQSLHPDAQLTRLIGVGSTFNLPGLRKYLKQQIGMEVYRIEEFKKLSDADIPAERKVAFKEAALNLTTAYGLALRGLGMATINADLMPVSIVREGIWKQKTKWFVLAAGLGIAAGAAMFIRPLMDYMAINATSEPEIIKQAISAANGERDKATKAGVVGTATSDFRAANLASLTERRDLYGFIMTDLSSILDDANSKAKTWAKDVAQRNNQPLTNVAPVAFSVRSFDTQYFGPGRSPGLDPSAPAPRNGAPAARNDKARVIVQLKMQTTQPDPQEFVIDTVQNWLKTNQKRDGVPYTLSFSQRPWSVQIIDKTKDPQGAAAAAAANPAQTVDPVEAPAGKGAGPRRRMNDPTGYIDPTQQALGAAKAGDDPEAFAPLSRIHDAIKEPSPTAYVTVEWEVIIGADEAKDAGKDKDGKETKDGKTGKGGGK